MSDPPQTMQAAMYHRNDDVRLVELPVPEIGPGELLVKVTASGICGSDTMEWYRAAKAPLVLGHEIGGEIAAIGAGVEGFEVGQRISASHHVPCMECRHCQRGHHTNCHTLHTTTFDPGGFTQYLRLRRINTRLGVYPLPDSVTDDQATFVEPLACVIRGQERAMVGEGDTVLVVGCGLAGLLHVGVARALGAQRVLACDINGYRLEAARDLGAEASHQAGEVAVSLSDWVKEVNEGRLADRVILCTGAQPALESSLACIEPGGSFLFFAPTDPGVKVPIELNQVLWGRDVTLTTSYAGSPDDHRAAIELIRSGRVEVDRLITHRLPLAQAQEGFRLVAEAGDSLKVILKPWD